jgi:hypothetical protein|eukprot:COSAG06_NODE_30_length_31668_cov_6.255084_2_plen_1087_part_00
MSAEADAPHAVRAQLIAAANSDEPSFVAEALASARPFAAQLERDWAAASEAHERLSAEGTETARQLLRTAEGDAVAEIQRAIIKYAPVLHNTELQSLTRRLTDSLGSRAATAAASASPRIGGVIGQYRVVQKAVARAGFELSSAAVDVLSPGRTVDVVERRRVPEADDPHGAGVVRVRCGDGTWLSASNRNGDAVLAELPGSPSLASARSGNVAATDDGSRPSTPSEDGDTVFEHRANAQLGDAIRRQQEAGEEETPRTQLRLVKSEKEALQASLSLRDFEMEELAVEMDLLREERQKRQQGQRRDHQVESPSSPALPTPIPLPSPAMSASAYRSPDGSVGAAVARPRPEGEGGSRVTDASLALCEVVASNVRLPPDTASEVQAMMQEQRERWSGLAASLLRAQVTSNGAESCAGSTDWGPSELRLLVQYVQGYQKASLRGFLELTYALDEALRGSQAAASAPKVTKLQALFDDSSYGRPLGLKFVQASEWNRTGAAAGGGMVVKSVVDGGAAATACPPLMQGAVLIGINDKNVGALSYGQTAALLKVAGQSRPLQLTFNQLTPARSQSSDLAGRAAGVQIQRPAPAPPMTASERESVLNVLGRHTSLPPSELATVLASHEDDGYDTLCERVAKAFGKNPRQGMETDAPGARGVSADTQPSTPRERGVTMPEEVDEVRAMKAELLSELEAQLALNAEWALKHEELELEVSTLTAELVDLRAENEGYRANEAVGAWSGRGKHGAVADAVEAVSEAASAVLDRRALLLGTAVGARDSVSVAEVMTEWRSLLDHSRTGWRSEPRVAASVGTLGSALEVTLSTLQQLGGSLAEAEDEIVQLRAELASVHASHFKAASMVGGSGSDGLPQSMESAQTEIAKLRAQLALHDSVPSPDRGSSSSSGSPNRRAAAEATATAAAARAQVGTLRASLCQMVDEIDRLHARTLPTPSPTISAPAPAPGVGGGTLGLAAEESVGSSSSVRADLAEVARSLRKLGEVATAMSASRDDLAASQRETAALQADLRTVRDGQAAAAEMHSKEEMAEKDAQIAELSAVRAHTHAQTHAHAYSHTHHTNARAHAHAFALRSSVA